MEHNFRNHSSRKKIILDLAQYFNELFRTNSLNFMEIVKLFEKNTYSSCYFFISH